MPTVCHYLSQRVHRRPLMTSDVGQEQPPAGSSPQRRRLALTREQVLAAALELIDEGGVDALTMRRLGQALARNPMAVYRHAADKDALLDGVVEHVAAELVAPRRPDRNGHEDGHEAGDVSGEGDHEWEAVLRRTAHTFRRVALAHPHVVPLLLTRPLSGPLALRPMGTLRQLEQLLELLVMAG